LKQAEVEIAAMKEEYEEQHRAELAKCELQRQEVEQRAVEEATALAEERALQEKRIADLQAALSDERADFERIMTERTEHLAKVREALEQQTADLEKRLADFDKRRTAFEAVVFEKQKEVADNPDLPVLEEVTVDADDTEPADVRGMFAPLDAKPAEKPPVKQRPRWMVPAAVAGAVVALSAAIAGAHYENEGRGAAALAAAKNTPVRQSPIPEGVAPRRGGFLSQTAAGSLSPKSFPMQPYATAADSARVVAAAAAAVDTTKKTTASGASEEPRPKPKPVVREPAPAEPTSLFSLPPRRPNTETIRRDSVRPDSIRRDSTTRPDTTFKRDTTKIPIDTMSRGR
jgi:hypothetical protein